MATGSNVISNFELVGSTNPVGDILRRTEERLNVLEQAYRGEARTGPGVLAVGTVAELPPGVATGTLVYVVDTGVVYTCQPGGAYAVGGVIPGFP